MSAVIALTFEESVPRISQDAHFIREMNSRTHICSVLGHNVLHYECPDLHFI